MNSRLYFKVFKCYYFETLFLSDCMVIIRELNLNTKTSPINP